MKVKYAIIGGGTAGLTARSEIAKFTEDYVIIERNDFGTTCAKVGCMPSKALIHLAEDYHSASYLNQNKFIRKTDLIIEGAEVLNHVRSIRDRLSGMIIKNSASFEEKKIMGVARFIDEHTLDVDGQKIEAEKIIIATGSTPVVPSAWKKLSDKIITSDQIFEQEILPEKMAVIGLGPIGLEIGQAFHRLGVDVFGFDMASTISGSIDPEISRFAIEHFRMQFPLQLGKQVEVVKGKMKELRVGNEEVDLVLLAMGRKPNLSDLNLAGIVELDDKGMPQFDSTTMQIKGTDIFIAGDVNNYRPILHEASEEGRIAASNAISGSNKSYKRKTPLGITFTDPNIAFVGKRFNEIENPVVGSMNLSMLGRTIAMNSAYGLIRIYGEMETKKIVGAEIASVKAENLVHLIALMIEEEYTVERALRVPFYHPVLEEGLKNALRSLAKEMNMSVNEIEEL